jgi:SseB protein N-terminal domain
MTAGDLAGYELVIVPAVADAGEDGRQLAVRRQADGTRTLPVFSSVARLVDEMGRQQAWVCMPMRAAAAAASRASVDRVTLDPVLGAGAWPPSSRS